MQNKKYCLNIPIISEHLPICTSSMCSIKSFNLGNVIPQPLYLQMFIMNTAIAINVNTLVKYRTVLTHVSGLIILLNELITANMKFY